MVTTDVTPPAKAAWLNVLKFYLYSYPGSPTKAFISTIHGIKGGESDNVVVISDISYKTWRKFNVEPDDEHRVFYVAITRAKKNLFLLQPETKNSYELR